MHQASTFQVYNASAGSGKTFTLVKEYLKVILGTEDRFKFQQILAITFTNKAAAEMKERIMKNLQLFSEGETNDLLLKLKQETNLDQQTIQQRSKQIVDAILQNYSAFGITTIDSFTHKIIKSFAFDLGLNLNFEVELDSDLLLQQAVDVLISKIGVENDITNTLIDYSIEKAQDDKSWDISRDLNDFAKILLRDDDAKHFKKLSSKTISDFTELKKKLITQQIQIEKQFAELGNNVLELIENKGLKHEEFSYRGEFPNHFKKLTNLKFIKPDDIKFTGRLNKTIEEGKNLYAAKTNEHSKQQIDSIKEDLIASYYSSKELYETKIKEYVLSKLALKSIIPLAVLTRINRELTSIKEENNIRLISEFNQLISNNIQGEPAPFIYERIGQKFMHYFIDEMQDTSVLQWQNLIPLIDNVLAQENSNLLLVGDGKQAIYRWRGSKAEQFIKLGSEEQIDSESNPFQIKKQIEGLETNYRSYSNLVEFNNSFFQYASGHFNNPLYQELFLKGNQQKANDKKGGFISIDFLEKEGREDESLKYAERVADIILNLDKGFARKDVCVLVRKGKEGVEIANYLSTQGIEIVSSETLLLKNSKKVNFIVNLLQVITHPKDESSWVKLLYYLHDHLEVKEDKHSFIASFNIKESTTFYKQIKNYNIGFDLAEFNQLPFYEKIEEIIRAFKLVITTDAYLQFFLETVYEQQKKGTSIQQFLDFWEIKKDKLSIVAPESENAVQIMTIHKSKGLEFPVVIFPYNIKIHDIRNQKAWYSKLPIEQYSGFEELLIDSNKNLELTGQYGASIYNEQKSASELDNFNLLYVVLTRAIEQLYVVTEKTIKSNGDADVNFASGIFINYLKENQLWSDSKYNYQIGNSKKISKSSNILSSSKEQKEFISHSWKQHNIYMVANSSKLWDTEQGKAIEYGNLIHEMLSRIVYETEIDKVCNQYLLKDEITSSNFSTIKSTIEKIIYHPKIKEYFTEGVIVFNEREIITVDKQIVIPDRIVLTKNNNNVTIIDYKTGVPSRRHHQQLNSYEEAVESIGYKVDKKLLIYINEEIIIEEI